MNSLFKLSIAFICILLFNVGSKAQTSAKVPAVASNPILYAFEDPGNFKIWNSIRFYKLTQADGSVYSPNNIYLEDNLNKYTLVIPNDNSIGIYIDPLAYWQDTKAALKFWYNNNTSSVYATAYRYNKTTGVIGDSVRLITDQTFIKNRLQLIFNQHLFFSDINNTPGFYISKSNDMVQYSTTSGFKGAGNIYNNTNSQIQSTFNGNNGHAYIVDKPISETLNSVYNVLMSKPEFSAFDSLLTGIPDTCINQIFVSQGNYKRIKMLNNYHYTVYVPSNTAIQNAIAAGKLHDWNYIDTIANASRRSAEIQKLIRTLKYHFQENEVVVGSNTNKVCNTFTFKYNNTVSHWKSGQNKFYKLGVNADVNGITLTTDAGTTAHVITTTGNYNLFAKEFIFSKIPSLFKNVDGSGNTTGTDFITSYILSSSSVAIHQIDELLVFE